MSSHSITLSWFYIYRIANLIDIFSIRECIYLCMSLLEIDSSSLINKNHGMPVMKLSFLSPLEVRAHSRAPSRMNNKH